MTVSLTCTGDYRGQEVAGQIQDLATKTDEQVLREICADRSGRGSVQPVAAVATAQPTQAADSQHQDTIPLSRRPAWTVLGVGIGQVEILFTGLVMATAVVGTYRVATRGSRYGR